MEQNAPQKEIKIPVIPIAVVVIVIVVVIGIVMMGRGGGGSLGGTGGGGKSEESQKPKVIEEKLVIPKTEKIVGTAARVVQEGNVDVQLVPKSEGEKVIVPKAILTVKGGYTLALSEAEKWEATSKLVFVKSLGAVTLEGKSSQWQVAFASKTKKAGYEVIVQADKIVSKKEIALQALSAEVPKNWFDSDGVIKTLQGQPNFVDATVSAINFYYDTDSKTWMYAVSTSKGATSIAVP